MSAKRGGTKRPIRTGPAAGGGEQSPSPAADRNAEERSAAPEKADLYEASGIFAWAAGFFPALALFFVLFFPIIFLGQQFCFRDSGDYYYPLFRQVQEDLNAGRLPLWDMYENFGQPLMANPTVSFFYPGKLIFFLTAIFPGSYGFCYKWYILLHFPIAFFGMYRLARHWSLSRSGGALAALCYTFSGPVFFQYCNVIFLIAAAWLPWGLLQGDRLLRTGHIKNLLGLSAILFLMISGGEPQMAYLTGLLCFTLWTYYYFLNRKERVKEPEDELRRRRKGKTRKPLFLAIHETTARVVQCRLGLLILSGIFGGILSFAVILPAQKMARQTDRAVLPMPSSIWQIPTLLIQNRSRGMEHNLAHNIPVASRKGKSSGVLIHEGIFAKEPIQGTHASAIYMRSLMPLRSAEFFWPSFCGNPMSNDQWWASPLCRDLFWSPSIYFGIFPVLLAITALRFRRRCDHSPRTTIRIWLSWTALVFFLATWGTYGPAWFARTFSSIFIVPQSLEYGPYEPVGGVYWLFTVFLPLFASFRYPEKLMTIVILAAALLAGLEYDRVLESKSFRRLGIVTALFSLILFGLLAIFGTERLLPECLEKRLLPLDASGTDRVLRLTFLQPLVMLALYFLLFYVTKRKGGTSHKSYFVLTAFLLLTADLIIALRPYLPTVPEALLSSVAPISERIHAQQPGMKAENGVKEEVKVPPRLLNFYYDICPMEVNLYLDYRLTRWRKSGLFPKHSATDHIAVFPTFLTMEPPDALVIYSLLHGELVDSGKMGPDFFAKLTKRFDIDVVALPEIVDGSPFLLEPLDSVLGGTGQQRTEELVNPNFRPGGLIAEHGLPYGYAYWKTTVPSSRIRIVRNREKAGLGGSNSENNRSWAWSDALNGEQVRLTRYEASRVEFDVTLKEPGSVLLADQYWPGWKAICRPANDPNGPGKESEIIYDYTQRRVDLPAGDWRVTMVYRPTEIGVGMAVSLLAWILLAGIAVGLYRRGRNKAAPLSAGRENQAEFANPPA